ncbi:MAG TPA: hypothetical protein VHC22_24110 [Pirellulales bacterium]|nr:hypothetical protein [Pirellulales bacterium]
MEYRFHNLPNKKPDISEQGNDLIFAQCQRRSNGKTSVIHSLTRPLAADGDLKLHRVAELAASFTHLSDKKQEWPQFTAVQKLANGNEFKIEAKGILVRSVSLLPGAAGFLEQISFEIIEQERRRNRQDEVKLTVPTAAR